MSDQQLLSYEEVAKQCQVSVALVRKWVYTKQLEVIKLGHVVRRVRQDALEKFLKTRTSK